MTPLQALLLGVVQGISEFLPISSSGHLVLLESALGLHVEDLRGFDVVVHVGTLVAIFAYFRKDIWALRKNLTLATYILIATVPAVIVGFTLKDALDSFFRDPKLVLGMLAVLGLFFLIAERFPHEKNRTQFTLKNTLTIGLAQAAALIPGISRSGSTIATGLLFGLKREEAARFSFLLGIPAIGGAAALTTLDVFTGEVALPENTPLLIGFFSSAVVGYLSVAFLMKFLKTHTLRPFTAYLWIVSVIGWTLLI